MPLICGNGFHRQSRIKIYPQYLGAFTPGIGTTRRHYWVGDEAIWAL